MTHVQLRKQGGPRAEEDQPCRDMPWRAPGRELVAPALGQGLDWLLGELVRGRWWCLLRGSWGRPHWGRR